MNDGGAALLPSDSGLFGQRRDPQLESRMFGGTPSLSLVARDWGGTQVLMGQTSVGDTLRLSRSIRMVVTRVRLSEGKVAPFASLGLGQWRVDTDLVPALPRDTELATQLGGGVELRIAPRWCVALELDYTVLYREQHEPQMVSGPHLWATVLGTRATF